MKSTRYSCQNIKFHENPSSWSPVVPCGRTDREIDMTELITAFRNFVNESKKPSYRASRLTVVKR